MTVFFVRVHLKIGCEAGEFFQHHAELRIMRSSLAQPF